MRVAEAHATQHSLYLLLAGTSGLASCFPQKPLGTNMYSIDVSKQSSFFYNNFRNARVACRPLKCCSLSRPRDSDFEQFLLHSQERIIKARSLLLYLYLIDVLCLMRHWGQARPSYLRHRQPSFWMAAGTSCVTHGSEKRMLQTLVMA